MTNSPRSSREAVRRLLIRRKAARASITHDQVRRTSRGTPECGFELGCHLLGLLVAGAEVVARRCSAAMAACSFSVNARAAFNSLVRAPP